MRDHPSSRWIVWVKSSKQTSPLKELNQLVESVQNEYIKNFRLNLLNMAGRTSILLAPKCMAWLALFIILCSDEPGKEQDSRIVNVFIASALNIKHFPARNSCNSRKYVKRRRIASSAKYLTAINFGEIALLATYLVLLSGKVMTNPEPSHYGGDVPTFLQKPGLKTAHLNIGSLPKHFNN